MWPVLSKNHAVSYGSITDRLYGPNVLLGNESIHLELDSTHLAGVGISSHHKLQCKCGQAGCRRRGARVFPRNRDGTRRYRCAGGRRCELDVGEGVGRERGEEGEESEPHAGRSTLCDVQSVM